MLRVVLLLLVSINFLFANYALFHDFDKNYQSASKKQLQRYHNDLKGTYIKSIMNNDLKLKINSLERLVITSDKLNLSSKAYQKELETLMTSFKKKGANKDDISKLSQKIKTSQAKNQEININKINTKVKSSNAKVLQIQINPSSISLVFNDEVKDIDIKNFTLKGKDNYRYVYDLGAILIKKPKQVSLSGIDQIRISQYNKKTLRVVFQTTKARKFYYTKVNNTIKIGFDTIVAENKTNKKEPIISTNKKIQKRIIVIDAGHGGKDGGAQGGKGRSEKEVVLKASLRLGEALKQKGFVVYYTRTKDKFIGLRDRTHFANKKNADLFISVHANAAPSKAKYDMQGVETFFLSPARSERSKNVAALENKSDLAEMNYFSKQTYLNFLNREKILASNKLAIDVQQGMLDSVRKKYKVKDGGVREAPFWVLVGAQMPAILVELGYITHKIEGKRLVSNAYLNLLAHGIANGIESYFDKNPQ